MRLKFQDVFVKISDKNDELDDKKMQLLLDLLLVTKKMRERLTNFWYILEFRAVRQDVSLVNCCVQIISFEPLFVERHDQKQQAYGFDTSAGGQACWLRKASC